MMASQQVADCCVVLHSRNLRVQQVRLIPQEFARLAFDDFCLTIVYNDFFYEPSSNKSIMEKILRRHTFILSFSIIVLLCQIIAACAPDTDFGLFTTTGVTDNKKATLSVFLNIKDHSENDVVVSISSIEVRKDGLLWVPLIEKKMDIHTEQMAWGQTLLVSSAMEPGRYDSFRIRFEKAAINERGAAIPLVLQQYEKELPVSNPLLMQQGDSQSVFFVWDVVSSIKNFSFIPAITVLPQSAPLISDIAYIACPDIDTVYLIRTDKNQVCGSLGIPGRPGYLAVDQFKNRLYVLSMKSATINVVELTTNRIVDVIHIPMTFEVNFMTISPDGRWAYLLDKVGNYVLNIDMFTGSLVNRTRIGDRPVYATYIEKQRLLAVSTTQAVYLLEPVSLAQKALISVGGMPQGLVARNDILYIAENVANLVTMYDLSRMQLRERINVSSGPSRFLVFREHIYLSANKANLVSLLLPGQLSVLKEIHVGNSPLEMAASPMHGWLYVGLQGGKLAVIDLTTSRVMGEIRLGGPPLGMAVLQ